MPPGPQPIPPSTLSRCFVAHLKNLMPHDSLDQKGKLSVWISLSFDTNVGKSNCTIILFFFGCYYRVKQLKEISFLHSVKMCDLDFNNHFEGPE